MLVLYKNTYARFQDHDFLLYHSILDYFFHYLIQLLQTLFLFTSNLIRFDFNLFNLLFLLQILYILQPFASISQNYLLKSLLNIYLKTKSKF